MRRIAIPALVAGLAVGATVSVPLAAHATGTITLQSLRAIGINSGVPPTCACAGLYGWGAATELDGNVLVGDYWNLRIQLYSPTGTLIGTEVPNDHNHVAPYGIAVDPTDGSIYFGDVDNGGGPRVDHYSYNSTGTGTFLGAITTPKTGTFNYPARVAVATDGNVFVSDQRNHSIDVFDKNGSALLTFGGLGSADGEFNSPRGIALDPSNNLYVADNYNFRIQEFTESGTFIRKFGSKGSKPGQFGGRGDLRGLALDTSRGLIYVSDAASEYVSQYLLSTGAYTGVRFGGKGFANGKFGDGPREITVDKSGNIWVGDLANFRVQQFSPAGAFVLLEPNPAKPPPLGGFNGAMGVTLGGAGNVWASDRYNQRVEELTNDGSKTLLAFGKRGSGPSGMNYDRAIAYDANDNTIYLADTDHQAVKKFDTKGNFICTVGAFGTALGQFNEPQGIDVGPDGTVYVADSLNQRVQVFSPNSCTPVSSFGSKGNGPGQFQFLRTVEYDPTDGSLWTADQALGVVEHFSGTGTWLSTFGSPGTATNQFSQPSDIEVDGDYVLVTDTFTHDIKIWTKEGTFVSAYGSFGTGLGRFAGPYGIELGSDGNLYVMEQQNERINVLSVTIT